MCLITRINRNRCQYCRYIQRTHCTEYSTLSVQYCGYFYLLRQRGYAVVVLCVFEQLCAKISKRICMKFSGKVGNGTVSKSLNFGGNPGHRSDPNPYHNTGKTFLDGGMHCPSVSIVPRYVSALILFVHLFWTCESFLYPLITSVIIFVGLLCCDLCLRCFDAVGWAAGRASGL